MTNLCWKLFVMTLCHVIANKAHHTAFARTLRMHKGLSVLSIFCCYVLFPLCMLNLKIGKGLWVTKSISMHARHYTAAYPGHDSCMPVRLAIVSTPFSGMDCTIFGDHVVVHMVAEVQKKLELSAVKRSCSQVAVPVSAYFVTQPSIVRWFKWRWENSQGQQVSVSVYEF